jgi:FAD/FMN-containing dehydrogenase
VLLETSEHQSAELAAVFKDFLEAQLNQGHIHDAVFAENISQAKALWSLGKTFPWHRQKKVKISSTIFLSHFQHPAFIATTNQLLARHFAGSRVVCFGHMGDGNLHYNVSPATGQAADVFIRTSKQLTGWCMIRFIISRIDLSRTWTRCVKEEEILRYKSPIEMNLMR